MNQKRSQENIGLIAALSCATLWGFLPIYWDALKPIDSFVIIFYRITLMTLVCFVLSFWQQRSLKAVFAPMFESWKKTLIYICAGMIITLNWSIYIWAVNAGFVIQCSMGYFLEPLLICVFGVVFYKEKANGWKKLSMAFAVVGLLVMIIGYGQLPVISVGLGLTFAVYSAVKKSVDLPPMQSLLYETVLVTPVALGLMFYYESSGAGALSVGGGKFILLLFAGIATAVPMGLFSFAASRVQLITLGLTEYIAPSIALILGIYLFKEPFDIIQFTAFAIIWVGLVFFTYGEIRDMRDKRKEELQHGAEE